MKNFLKTTAFILTITSSFGLMASTALEEEVQNRQAADNRIYADMESNMDKVYSESVATSNTYTNEAMASMESEMANKAQEVYDLNTTYTDNKASETLNQAAQEVNNEANKRIDADNHLQENIDTEVAARITADGKLETKINTVEATIGDANFQGTHYAGEGSSVTQAIRNVDAAIDQKLTAYNNNIQRLDDRIDDVEQDMKQGFAAMAALSGLQANARALGNTQVAVGGGMYRSKVGGAVGLYHYFNDNVLVNAGVAYAGDNSTTARAGVSFGW